MTIAFDVQLKTGNMFYFFLCNAYSSAGGKISNILAAVLIIFGLVTEGWVYAFFGLLVLIMTPFTLFMRSWKEIHRKGNPYTLPLHYEVSEEKLCLSQDGHEAFYPWSDFKNALFTPRVIAIFTAKSVYIIPRDNTNGQDQQLEEILNGKLTIKKFLVK